jgi:uncharacterized membrane protein
MHKSTRWLIWEIGATISIVIVLAFFHHPLLLSYQWHKLLHILGAVLLIGNIVITAVWMYMAELTRNADVIRFAVKMVNWADVFFTAPGIFLLITNGDILSEQAGGVFHASWIVAALGLFVLSGVVWVGQLLRLQNGLIEVSASAPDKNLPPEFFRMLHQWYFWGAVATVLPLISLVLMFLKPTLW